MPKTRRLTDLYVVGAEVTFDDGAGDPVTVYVRKLNPVDHETAIRASNAARARTTAIKSDPAGDEYIAIQSALLTYDVDGLVDYLVEDRRNERTAIIEASVADEDKWKDDGYLQGLKDDWDGGLNVEWAKDPTNVDGVRVKAELERYQAEVDKVLDAELDDLRDELEARPVESLRESVFEKVLDVRASLAWLSEYHRCEVWLSLREVDRHARYFENRAEVDELPAEVFDRLSDAYAALSVDVTEGKDSAATQPSSLSSEQPVDQVTDESSGPTGAAA